MKHRKLVIVGLVAVSAFVVAERVRADAPVVGKAPAVVVRVEDPVVKDLTERVKALENGLASAEARANALQARIVLAETKLASVDAARKDTTRSLSELWTSHEKHTHPYGFTYVALQSENINGRNVKLGVDPRVERRSTLPPN